MATVLIGRERTGNAELSATKEGLTYSETYDYLVMSDDPFEDYTNVLNTAGLPVVFVTTLNGLNCTGKSASRDEGHAGLWHVSCQFSQEPTGQEDTADDPDPTTWTPVWTGTIEPYEEVLYACDACAATLGKTGTLTADTPYCNSAGDQFPDPLTIQKPVVVMEFAQYESYNLTPDAIAARNDKINNAAFKGFGKRTLKVNVRSFEKGYYFNYPCTKVNYAVAYKPDVWCIAPLDIGYEHILDPGGADVKVSATTIRALNASGEDIGDVTDAVVNGYYFPWGETDFSAFIR